MKPAMFLPLVISHVVLAQQGDYSLGARSSAMGGAHVTLYDQYAVFNNPGGVASLDKSAILFSVKNLYTMRGLSVLGTAYNHQYRQGAFMISLYRFGDQLFNEHKIGMGYSHKISFVSLGIQLNYLQHAIRSIGSSGSFVIEAGGMAMIFPGITLGAYIFNPNRAVMDGFSVEPVPVMLKTGIAYQPDERTLLVCEVHRYPDHSARTKAGMEYILKERFPLRTGVVFKPVRISIGFGIYLKKFRLDYSAEMDPELGMTNQFSVIYLMGKK
jgi:hypothetical protein